MASWDLTKNIEAVKNNFLLYTVVIQLPGEGRERRLILTKSDIENLLPWIQMMFAKNLA